LTLAFATSPDCKRFLLESESERPIRTRSLRPLAGACRSCLKAASYPTAWQTPGPNSFGALVTVAVLVAEAMKNAGDNPVNQRDKGH
jgi:hypothetical protein